MDDSIFQIKELVGCRACMKENIKNDMVYLFDIKNIENNLFSKCTEIEVFFIFIIIKLFKRLTKL